MDDKRYYRQKGLKKISAGLQLAVVCAMAIALATAPTAQAQGTTCDAPPSGTMVAWYPFDETGTTFTGPSANLATQNSAAWDSLALTGNPLPTPITGKVAGALDFRGDSYIDSPDSIVTNFGPAGNFASCGLPTAFRGDFSSCQGNFSMDVWVNLSAPLFNGVVATIVDKRDAGPIRV